MKAFLIDPARFVIEPVDIHPDNAAHQIYAHIGCDRFDAVYLDNHDTLYVDDEGLLKPQHHFIILDGYPQPLAGKGLLLGATPHGDNADAHISLQQLTDKITFMERLLGPVVSLRAAVASSHARLANLHQVLARMEAITQS